MQKIHETEVHSAFFRIGPLDCFYLRIISSIYISPTLHYSHVILLLLIIDWVYIQKLEVIMFFNPNVKPQHKY